MLNKISSHLRRISYHLGKKVVFGTHHFKMHGYYASRIENSDTRHESYLIPVLRRLLDSRSGAFIDIGVNVGQTLSKILGVDRNRLYLGFDPQIACCFNIEQFLRLNNLWNAKILPIALSNSNSILSFYSQNQFDEMASLTNESRGAGGQVIS